MKTTIVNGKEIPVIDADVKTIISNKKTGEIYQDEIALKAANIPEEDVKRDVQVIMPTLDLFAKT
tara:strand:+ start:376 stop:570 length:195 start_codon:yes stop_codon:yes gene_type:complete